MTYNYVATAYPSQLVKFSAIGHFLLQSEPLLVTIKSRMLELYAIHEEGELIAHNQIRIPSHVVGLWRFRPKVDGKDFIVLLTQQNELSVLEFTLVQGKVEMHTKCKGKFPVVDDCKVEPLAAFHPEHRFMCLSLYGQRLVKMFFRHF